jgi:hypothetical protein
MDSHNLAVKDIDMTSDIDVSSRNVFLALYDLGECISVDFLSELLSQTSPGQGLPETNQEILDWLSLEDVRESLTSWRVKRRSK